MHEYSDDDDEGEYKEIRYQRKRPIIKYYEFKGPFGSKSWVDNLSDNFLDLPSWIGRSR